MCRMGPSAPRVVQASGRRPPRRAGYDRQEQRLLRAQGPQLRDDQLTRLSLSLDRTSGRTRPPPGAPPPRAVRTTTAADATPPPSPPPPSKVSSFPPRPLFGFSRVAYPHKLKKTTRARVSCLAPALAFYSQFTRRLLLSYAPCAFRVRAVYELLTSGLVCIYISVQVGDFFLYR